ncbi:hypothetical protein [Lentzea cavernae]|uniref:Uncharacterized protein n=1 Tax=Lentzea cavernae TaxID=2020703 RepID=A0ABQ3MR27_9PSEU|nr:hypothetical protein [Lentzea cavernae]GHH56844.1 hypothetical protein GCM10017774_75420 [Lentzea cavernae]
MGDFEDQLRQQVHRARQQDDREKDQIAEVLAGMDGYRAQWAEQARAFVKVAAEIGIAPHRHQTQRTIKKRFGRTATETTVLEYHLIGTSGVGITLSGDLVEGREQQPVLRPLGELKAELVTTLLYRDYPAARAPRSEVVVKLSHGRVKHGVTAAGELLLVGDHEGYDTFTTFEHELKNKIRVALGRAWNE